MYTMPSELSDAIKPEKNWLQRLIAGQRWRSERLGFPPLAAYYWEGGASVPHRVRDISESGLYLLTKERWYPRTIVMMTLQSGNYPDRGSKESIMIQAMVIRCDNEGVGLAFVPSEVIDCRRGECILAHGADKATLRMFLRQVFATRGKASVNKSAALSRSFSLPDKADQR